jgi:2-phospho-L-lactate transferase/gluconeogenesis factor (CofD/UPF0052 family)
MVAGNSSAHEVIWPGEKLKKLFPQAESFEQKHLSSNVYAESLREKETTPYGDNCPLCGEYGYCSNQPTHEEAANALKSYFGKRGLRVIVLKQKDRFLEVEVYRNGTPVDRVILDLRTGRIRSMY